MNRIYDIDIDKRFSEDDRLRIRKSALGLYKTNCYVLIRDGYALIVDPGFHPEVIREMIGDAQPVAILLTHGHVDHRAAAGPVAEAYGLPVHIHPKDEELLYMRRRMPSAYKILFTAETKPLAEGRFKWGPFSVSVLETPGHSEGSVCIAVDRVLLTGDTLFKGTAGRVAGYDGAGADLKRSLERLASLPGDYLILPGHAEYTTLEAERQYNPHLKGEAHED